MLIGYARVSKENGQDTATQVAALKAAGVERLYEEHASGGRQGSRMKGYNPIRGTVLEMPLLAKSRFFWLMPKRAEPISVRK